MPTSSAISTITALVAAHPTEAARWLSEEIGVMSTSESFVRSPGSIRLLQFIVDAELGGSLHLLRETPLAEHVYGREKGYDPQLDAIVRVSANRLRHRLEKYAYKHPQRPLRLTLPKGSYRLEIEFRPQFVALIETHEEPAQEVAQEQAAPLPSETIEDLSRSQDVRLTGATPPLWPFAAGLALLLLAFAGIALRITHSRKNVPESGIWVERPLSHAGGLEQFPVFTPDGKAVVFSWILPVDTPRGLFIQALSSDTPQALAGSQPGDMRPEFSPDGKSLAFVRRIDDDQKQIVLRRMADGKETVAATLHGQSPWLCADPRVSWSSDGQALLTAASGFAQSSAGDQGRAQRCSIVRIDLSTHQITPLTQSPEKTVGDIEPAVSPDGQNFVFLRSTSIGYGVLYLQPVNGGPLHPLMVHPEEVFGLTWAPDGKSVVYSVRDHHGQTAIKRLAIADGRETILSQGSVRSGFPAFSPDSNHLVLARYSGSSPLYIHADGKDEELLPDGNSKRTAVISPDHKWLAYSSDRTGNSEIWLADMKTGISKRLTVTPTGGAGRPQWFRDSQRLIYECRIGDHTQTCMCSISDATHPREITSGQSDQVLPTLAHDEQSILYSSNRSGVWEIYRQSLNTGKSEAVTVGGGMYAIESLDGKSVYITAPNAAVGTLVAPSDAVSIPTAQPDSRNAVYRRPELTMLRNMAWTPGRGGVIFASFKDGASEIKFFNEEDRSIHTVGMIRRDRPIDTMRVSPEGKILYSLRPNPISGINVLTRQ